MLRFAAKNDPSVYLKIVNVIKAKRKNYRLTKTLSPKITKSLHSQTDCGLGKVNAAMPSAE